MKRNIAIAVTCAILCMFIYKVVDTSVTIDHLASQNELLFKKLATLRAVFLVAKGGKSLAAIEHQLREQNPRMIIQKEGDVVYFDSVGLKMNADQIVDVILME